MFIIVILFSMHYFCYNFFSTYDANISSCIGYLLASIVFDNLIVCHPDASSTESIPISLTIYFDVNFFTAKVHVLVFRKHGIAFIILVPMPILGLKIRSLKEYSVKKRQSTESFRVILKSMSHPNGGIYILFQKVQ